MNLFIPASLPVELQDAVTIQQIDAGQVLFQPGEQASVLYMVETGRVKLIRYTDGDETVTLEVVGAGESLAEMALFSDVYSCGAIAEARSRVVAYPRVELLAALRRYPDLAEDLMTLLVNKIQSFKVRLELRDIRASHERVLRYLRYLAQPQQQTVVRFDRPLKDVAAELGFTPETLSRALTRLEREGKITRQLGQITLHDSPAA